MKLAKKSAIIITIFIIHSVYFQVHAQSCQNYEKRCENAPTYFEKSSLSRSVTMRKARKVVINQTFFGDREYFISVCGRKKLGDIHFRLISDDENQTVLYDNAAVNFQPSQLFVIQNTMKIKIELSAPHYFDDYNSECAGVQISYHKSGQE
jgi:hypothetical protein